MKSQVTFYIVGALVVLIFLIMIFSNSDPAETLNIGSSLAIRNIHIDAFNVYAEKCVYDSSIDALYKTAFHGGYNNPATSGIEYINYKNKHVAYWNKGYLDISPSYDTIIRELSSFVTNQTINCIASYDEPSLILDFDGKKANTEISFFDENINIVFKLPVELKSGNSKNSLSAFSTKIDYNYDKNLLIAKNILKDISIKQTKFYDINENCEKIITNKMTKIFITNYVAEADNNVRILSIMDYEPYFEHGKQPLVLNLALRNITVTGYCNDF